MSFTTGTAPGAIPGLGHIWPLMRSPVDFLTSLPDYGDLVEIRLGVTPGYVPCHPELLRQTLIDDRTFDKGGKYYDRARAMAGNGVATCAHKDHRRQRRMMQPAFHHQQLERYGPVVEEEIAALTEHWGDEQVIDAYSVLYGLSLRTVTRTLFAAKVDEEVVEGIRHSFDIAFSGFFRQMFLPRAVLELPLPANRRHRRALGHLRDTVHRVVADSRATEGDEGNVLAALMASEPDDQEIHDQVVTVLAAGSETVASTLTWALYLLSEHPEAARALQNEIDTVLAGRPARWADIPQLPGLHRVVNETVRLYPAGWLFTRVTTRDVELAGTLLKEGSTVVITPVPVHRNTELFEDAAAFAPERWLPERISGLPRGAFAGFGTGPRKCVGDDYGVGECVLALAAILGGWDVQCEPGADTRPVPLAAFYRPRKLTMRLIRRVGHHG
ncbi:cytochrome P450 [Streptomyces davaonensis JCM 4913]|uniref:Cytochrome P450 n=2 Tax=Streptomyces davaonensis TaxID=348043 RepID=K4QT57_STRDJ|nr:cytochrome P450 [Streptomyces davaonensis JCM 4913]